MMAGRGSQVRVLALLVLLTACGGAPADVEHVLGDKGFAITAPADWQVEQDIFGISLSMHPPQARSPLAHVTVGIDENRPLRMPGAEVDPEPTLERYATLKLERSGFLTAPARVLQQEAGKLNGQPVIRVVRSYRSGPVEYKAMLYFLLGPGGNGYTLTATAPVHEYDGLASQFEHVLESFRLLDRAHR
jgi:hypothetical protein